ncbi:MAG: hypothetical protein AAF713_09995 [Pseudomonadota bacterium]
MGIGGFEMHQIPLVKHGICFSENMETRALPAHQAWEPLSVLDVTRLAGAMQMIIEPFAIR